MVNVRHQDDQTRVFSRSSKGRLTDRWVDGSLAIDIRRALALERAGYQIRTQAIASDITPKNRLLLGAPALV